MKKVFKSIIAIVLVISICFTFSSCSSKEVTYYNFVNPLAEKSVADVMDMATEVEEEKLYTLDDDSTFEISSLKDKRFIVSASGVIISVVTMVIAFFMGGVYTIPSVYYSNDKSLRTIELEIEYENNSTEDVMIGDVVHVGFAYGNEELYTGFICHPEAVSLDFSCGEIIEVGEKETFTVLIDVPKEYLKNGDVFDLYFDLNGEVYTIAYSN